ncbi:MAG TPA: hypothetical protein VIV40_44395 [Kofleriaceae bacterium]
MSNDPSKLPSIDPAILEAVTGGLADSDGQILAALQGIQQTISDLGKKSGSGFSFEQFLPFLMFAINGGGLGGGACPCGCGRARCRHR